MSDANTTQKISIAPAMNEKQYAQWQYDQAREKMLKEPTEESIKAFERANKYLYEVQDAYRIGLMLLEQRAQQLLASVRGLYKR